MAVNYDELTKQVLNIYPESKNLQGLSTLKVKLLQAVTKKMSNKY